MGPGNKSRDDSGGYLKKTTSGDRIAQAGRHIGKEFGLPPSRK